MVKHQEVIGRSVEEVGHSSVGSLKTINIRGRGKAH